MGHNELDVALKHSEVPGDTIAQSIAKELGEDIAELLAASRSSDNDPPNSALVLPKQRTTDMPSADGDPSNTPRDSEDPWVTNLLEEAKHPDPKLSRSMAEQKTIFLIAGAFGLSKRALFEYFRSASHRRTGCAVVKKITCVEEPGTAVFRQALSPDLYNLTPEAFDAVAAAFGPNRFFDYTHNGQRYGIPKGWIINELHKAESVLLICHVPVIGSLIDDHFKHCRRVRAWVFLKWRTLTEQLLGHCGGDVAEAEWRARRAKEAWDDFIPDCVHYRLLSFDGTDKHRFTSHLDTLFELRQKT